MWVISCYLHVVLSILKIPSRIPSFGRIYHVVRIHCLQKCHQGRQKKRCHDHIQFAE